MSTPLGLGDRWISLSMSVSWTRLYQYVNKPSTRQPETSTCEKEKLKVSIWVLVRRRNVRGTNGIRRDGIFGVLGNSRPLDGKSKFSISLGTCDRRWANGFYRRSPRVAAVVFSLLSWENFSSYRLKTSTVTLLFPTKLKDVINTRVPNNVYELPAVVSVTE